MDNNKTLTQIYLKGINRFVKILYLFIYGFIVLFLYLVTDRDFETFFKPLLVTMLIFELIRRAFYYIATGTITPKKK
jgi:small-conductance mechanosensitive channel